VGWLRGCEISAYPPQFIPPDEGKVPSKSGYGLRVALLGLVLLLVILLSALAEAGARGTTLPGVVADLLRNGDWSSVTFFPLVIVRNAFPAVLALILVPLLASRFMRVLYAIDSLSEAHTYLHRSVFGLMGFKPYLLIKEGHIDQGEDSTLARLGGPGNLVIYNDNAVVLEQGGRLTRVCGSGFHHLKRFEKIWETVDLRPQRQVYKVTAMTKEGVPVSCEADITFKIDGGGQSPTKKMPYPFTKDAVFKAATSTWIREPEREDRKMKWPALVVAGHAEGTLRSILSGYRLDWLIAPPSSGSTPPRQAIRDELEKKLRESVGNVGAEIVKVELGEIEVDVGAELIARMIRERLKKEYPQLSAEEIARMIHKELEAIDLKDRKVSQQWIKAWQAEWQREATLQQAEGEAELARLEVAQVQAQAEMILTFTQALQPLVSAQEQVSPYLVALRLVETLRWMSYDPWKRVFLPPEATRTLALLQSQIAGQSEETGKPEEK